MSAQCADEMFALIVTEENYIALVIADDKYHQCCAGRCTIPNHKEDMYFFARIETASNIPSNAVLYASPYAALLIGR